MLCSGLLVLVMALAETRTPGSQVAVRPGSLVLSSLGAGVLAAAVPVLALWLIRLGLRDDRDRHRRLARIAWLV